MRMLQQNRRKWIALVVLLCGARSAECGGPRWWTGEPYFRTMGKAVVWFTPSPLYYTDPGDLNPNVTHAQADAMVAAAAAIWNVPASSLTMARGGALAEHLSGANSFFDGTAIVLPADVQASNYRAKQIAVVYDTDGSITDLLLGSGASDPSGCRQNGVTESVDSIDPSGVILHAIVVLNGRCVGASPQQLTQMQYQVMRAFGRVLGVGWSQLNDNVFTGARPPTPAELAQWPVMHPIDIVCGLYTYQCMRDPFTLRLDDISALVQLYPVTAQNLTAGKTLSMDGASGFTGTVAFPNGQGMEAVNVTFRRAEPFASWIEPAQMFSAVAGVMYRQLDGNSVTGSPVGLAQSSGVIYWHTEFEGLFVVGRVPIIGPFGWDVAAATTEAINPLYSGEFAVGPYAGTPMAMSGPPVTVVTGVIQPGYGVPFAMNQPSPAAACVTANDGTDLAPVAVDATGWWTSQLCGYGHEAWRQITVQAGHAWAIEVTALDEGGIATASKMLPVMGVWKSTDARFQLPTVAAETVALNAATAGTTQLAMSAASADISLRFVLSDQRGAGRPDFAYTARLLYASSASPALVSTDGGAATVQGMGFRNGNRVTVNGVAVKVTSWTANAITFVAPAMAAVHAVDGGKVDVAVIDQMTGAVATVPAAFAYSSAVQPVRSVTTAAAPRYLAAGAALGWAMSVLVTQNGVPAAGATVVWTATGGLQAVATSLTNAAGVATVTVSTAGLGGGVTATVTGCAWTTVCAAAPVFGVDAAEWRVSIAAGDAQSVRVGSAFAPVVMALTDAAGHPLEAAPVAVYQTVTAWQAACPPAGRCPSAPVLVQSQGAAVSDAAGSVTVAPLNVAGTPGVTNLAVAAGSQGFATATLSKTP